MENEELRDAGGSSLQELVLDEKDSNLDGVNESDSQTLLRETSVGISLGT